MGAGGRAADELARAHGQELNLLGLFLFAAYVHAVDHLAHVLGERLGVALERLHLLVEVVGEDPALAHVEVDLLAPDGFRLAVVDGQLLVVVGEVDACAGAGGLDGGGEADVEGAGFDGADEALGDEGDDAGLVFEVERGFGYGLEQGGEPLHRLRAGVDERLDFVLEVEVADLRQTDGAGSVGRGDEGVVGAVNAAVGGVGRKQRLDQDEQAAAVVTADGLLEINVGVEHHFGHGVVGLVGEGVVLGVVLEPDGVQVGGLGKGAQDGQNVDDGERVGRHLGLLDKGLELGGGAEEKGERDILGELPALVGELVLGHVLADRGLRGGGGGRLGGSLGEVGADLGPHGLRIGEAGVVAAGVEGGGEIEQRLAGFKGDGGACCVAAAGERRRTLLGSAAAGRRTR